MMGIRIGFYTNTHLKYYHKSGLKTVTDEIYTLNIIISSVYSVLENP